MYHLEEVDRIIKDKSSLRFHSQIESDNLIAIQYLIDSNCEKFDCIYIDPPYNTGERYMNYNNTFADNWVNMMKPRISSCRMQLKDDAVLIITIGDDEMLNLGILQRELFPDNPVDVISTLINPAGIPEDGRFLKTNEYIFIVYFGNCRPAPLQLSRDWMGNILEDSFKKKSRVSWSNLMRSGHNAIRRKDYNLFYPIFVKSDGSKIVNVGEPYHGDNRFEVGMPNGCVAIWPIRKGGDEGIWGICREKLIPLIEKGYVRLGRFNDRGTMAVQYLKRGEIKKIEDGSYAIIGHNSDGSVIIDDSRYQAKYLPGRIWNIPSHNASQDGSHLLRKILPHRHFSYPKSLYAVVDVLNFFVCNNPNARIQDFFAGSGTTLHAVNLINAKDGGNRQCVMITNNELSRYDRIDLSKAGKDETDDEWQNRGVARYITWPRTLCTINGVDLLGNPLVGTYKNSEVKMSDGFLTNVVYYRLLEDKEYERKN